MSNNNNDGGAFVGLALTFAALYIIGLVMYALACFVALILTIIAFLSWDEPLVVFGQEICNPHEAHIFVGSGVIGAAGLTAFVLFCSFLFGFRFQDEWLFYLLTGGYSFTSITVSWNLAEAQTQARQADTTNVIEHVPAPAPSLPPAPQPFQYASWEDEAGAGNPQRDCDKCCAEFLLATMPRVAR